MSFFIYPTPKRPQFYFSNRTNVLNFFIDKFFYLRKSELQFLITITKRIVPNLLIRLFIRLIMKKEKGLPYGMTEEINSMIGFIKRNKNLFSPDSEKHEDINFIIRKSKWHRINDKYVILFFKYHDKKPFTVAKVGYLTNEESIQKEYNNMKTVFDKFKENKLALIPEPIALYTSGNIITYFEKVIDGIPFNDYQKLITEKRRKQDLHNDILEKCKNFLVDLHLQKQIFTPEDFSKYFYEPIDNLSKTNLGEKYKSVLIELENQVRKIEKTKLYSVWMHGDFWDGSILYNNGNIGFIDWEFFSERGVPLWDYFSLVFHIGINIHYFTSYEISRKVDYHLLDLAKHCQIDKKYISTLFQGFLLFNVQMRDTDTEKYWQTLLEYYWNLPRPAGNTAGRLL